MSFGKRIRTLRKKRGYTLKDLSEKTGYSVSFISQIERDMVNPTVASLKIICDSLNVSLANIFDDKRFHNTMEDSFIVRKENRIPLTSNDSNVQLFLLSPNVDRRIEMILIVAQPGSNSGDEFHQHKGEECGVVIKGTFQCEMDGITYTLNEGDTMCFDSDQPHKWYNNSEQESVSIWAITPPSF